MESTLTSNIRHLNCMLISPFSACLSLLPMCPYFIYLGIFEKLLVLINLVMRFIVYLLHLIIEFLLEVFCKTELNLLANSSSLLCCMNLLPLYCCLKFRIKCVLSLKHVSDVLLLCFVYCGELSVLFKQFLRSLFESPHFLDQFHVLILHEFNLFLHRLYLHIHHRTPC